MNVELAASGNQLKTFPVVGWWWGKAGNKAYLSPASAWAWAELGKKDLRAMKRILYAMGLLTLVRWLLQRAFKFEPPFGPGPELRRVPPPRN